jgi:hypothetical protein
MDIPLIKGKAISHWIFRTHFTRNGVTYYARDYGKRAFRIPVYC